jgi:hypothetical protein
MGIITTEILAEDTNKMFLNPTRPPVPVKDIESTAMKF